MTQVNPELAPQPAKKLDPVQEFNMQIRKACFELEEEAKAALPKGSFLHTIYVSNSLARNGYSLARPYNTSVCNGMTLILAIHPDSVEVFSSLCSVDDLYTRLEGRFEVLKRLALKYNKSGVLPVEMTPLAFNIQKSELAIEGVPETLENIVRGSVNRFISEKVNSKGKRKPQAFVPTRAQVAKAEQDLVAALKAQSPELVDFRLTYSYKVPKTGMRSVMMRPYNVKAGTDVAFEETTVQVCLSNTDHNRTLDQILLDQYALAAPSATVVRYNGDVNNRLTARWNALKKLAKQVQRKNKRPQNV